MAFKAEDYGIPSLYQHWVGDKAEDYIGPFFFTMEQGNPRTAFRVEEHHCNAHESVHGGVLMAFADYTLCLGANGGESESVATVSCNCEFIAPALKGALIYGKGEVIRRGGSMVFVRCELLEEETVVLIASAVIKRIRKK
ncbi:MAG: thioesterase [SAR86 cluster bacterium]|uniref:Thioesterase n=1 Tax=SAR86 cluster bacterium TaxID=2030880 RepID=A0A2A5B559_9GAMM|nr:MAG: thioesterase [SAR86 cluster bacterium]